MIAHLAVVTLLLSFGICATYSASVSVCDEASLRAALVQGGDIAFACDGTITLGSTIQINTSGTLRANGHNVTISGGGAVQLFVINFGVTFTMEGLTLADGYLRGSTGFIGGPGGPADGGGILNIGFLTCNGCVFERNHVFGGVGGAASGTPGSLPGNGGPGRGGAICIGAGVVFLTDCVFRNNQSSGGRAGTPGDRAIGGDGRGGALYAIGGGYSLTRCIFTQNLASFAPGEMQPGQTSGAGEGGVAFLESASFFATDCAFNSNTAFGAPGGPSGGNGGAGRAAVLRGVASNVSMNNCSLENNMTTGGPGGTASTISPLTNGGLAEGGAIYCTGGTVRFTDCRLSFNRCIPGYSRRFGVNYATADAFGGAVTIRNATVLTLTRCVLDGNVLRSDIAGTCWGGAIYANGGQITLDECELSNNYAEGGRGGPLAGTFNGSIGHGFGGALHVQAGWLFSSNSTFRLNAVQGGLQTFVDSAGGNGLGGALFNRGTGVVENCTFAANLARGGDDPAPGRFASGGHGLGGAIYNEGSLSVTHATIASNAVQFGYSTNRNGLAQGGGMYSVGSVAELRALLLVGNRSSNWFGTTFVDRGYNLSSDASCPFIDATSASNIDPMIGPLGDYGGPTRTMPLLGGSPAIDRVVTGACPSRDQRGRARPYGAACDVGAFESSAPFTVRGRIGGPHAPAGIEVSNGGDITATAPDLSYRFDSLSPGTYVITPSPVTRLIVPASRTVSVNTDVLGVDFTAYGWNALLAERKRPNSLKLLYAGTNGNVVNIQSATQLPTWQDYSTNTVGADGLIQLEVPTADAQRLFRTVIP